MRRFYRCLNLTLSGLLAAALQASAASAQPVVHDLTGLMGLINPQCADFRILGPCSCTGAQADQACLQVAYHQPAYIVETVPIPGDAVIGAGLISPGAVLAPLLHTLDFAGGSSATPQDSGHAALTFREAHVYSVPKLLAYGCNACDGRSIPDAPLLTPHYLSELDFTAWRYLPDGAASIIPIQALSLAGAWGSLFPRIGFSQHDSPPVAAALLAWRAMSVAFKPGAWPWRLLRRAW